MRTFVGTSWGAVLSAVLIVAIILLPGCGGSSGPTGTEGDAQVVTPAATSNLAPAADTYLAQATPTQHLGTKTPLKLGGLSPKAMRILLRFGTITPPVGTPLTKAELQLYVSGVSGTDTYRAHPVTAAWTEAAATWANAASAYGPTAITSRSISSVDKGKLIRLDITSVVQGWIADPASNLGLMLRGSETTTANAQIAAREERNAARRPCLVLTYATSTSGVKNVIVMISDGCGYNQVEAGSLYHSGTSTSWPYQSFPVTAGMATFPNGGSYNPSQAWSSFAYVNSGATDSAAAATAMACGVKTYNGAIGVGPSGATVANILESAEGLGKSSGVVSSVPFSHATPAGFLVHNSGRGNYTEIAASMAASVADVVMGAGNPGFTDSGLTRTATYDYISSTLWSQLKAGTATNDADGDGVAEPWKLIQTAAEFQSLTTGTPPERVFGVAQVASTLQESRGGDSHAAAYAVPFNPGVPALSTMATGAINVLRQNPRGFCLMIEGGAIDWAGHSNLSGRLIEEETSFSEAVQAVINWIEANSSWSDTLLIVTADHETGYLTGPGSDPTWQPLINNGAAVMPGMEWHSGSHTNSLVPLFAKGQGSTYFLGHTLGTDPRRGAYVNNIDIAGAVRAAFGL